ncbi:MAG: alcohol dehydrogenase catalytic domain-containing protein [Anaerolineae bacterium]|nr:alcohol dehydrogenase catalytic domain-containing protein [Thermoflexales bacterium]MDW8406559.1 alcohol dehydrogenase catalytic domain-containing protein [Anaerolineae bacterium]
MSDNYTDYRFVKKPLPIKNRLWPLYGAGFENLGVNDQPIETDLPAYGPDELLIRHDACGLCFSDIKILSLGEKHPRIFKDMKKDPVVMGHEVCMTVVGVGENLKDQYQVGQRFIIQADIYVDGVGYAYGYMIQGGLSQYGVIDQRILNGDDGNYLIPIKEKTGYVESALVEPWACVIAAYQLTYRTGIKPGGVAWIIGGANADPNLPYTISAGFDEQSHPAIVLLTNVPASFAGWLKQKAKDLGIEVHDVPTPDQLPSAIDKIDDIIVLGADADIIEKVSPRLADFGVVAIVSEKPFARKASIDVGRIHYNRWVYVGTKSPDIARAYSDTPVRSTLKPGGLCWMVGAGGPIGRMHLQRAIELPDGPSVIVCTDVSDTRLQDLKQSFEQDARDHLITLVCLNPTKAEDVAQLAEYKQCGGFDDIIVLAPVASVIAEAATYLNRKGVMNVFAGVNRGVMADLDLSDVLDKDVRVIGHSASTIEDMLTMLRDTEEGRLSPNRSVAAIGSLEAAKTGLQALKDATYPGKVVIFPNIKELPITALPDLKHKLPTVYAKLKNGREWTVEAEEEFLRLMAL